MGRNETCCGQKRVVFPMLRHSFNFGVKCMPPSHPPEIKSENDSQKNYPFTTLCQVKYPCYVFKVSSVLVTISKHIFSKRAHSTLGPFYEQASLIWFQKTLKFGVRDAVAEASRVFFLEMILDTNFWGFHMPTTNKKKPFVNPNSCHQYYCKVMTILLPGYVARFFDGWWSPKNHHQKLPFGFWTSGPSENILANAGVIDHDVWTSNVGMSIW